MKILVCTVFALIALVSAFYIGRITEEHRYREHFNEEMNRWSTDQAFREAIFGILLHQKRYDVLDSMIRSDLSTLLITQKEFYPEYYNQNIMRGTVRGYYDATGNKIDNNVALLLNDIQNGKGTNMLKHTASAILRNENAEQGAAANP